MIKVSVVIPVRNGKSVLPDCLDVLRRQSYPAGNYEVIVVDDESNDGTPELVEVATRQWASEDPPRQLRVIRQRWGGAGAARNRGVKESQGEIIMFTDADCEPIEDWITELLKPFSDPQIACSAGGYLTHQESVVARLAQAEFEERYRLVERHDFIDIAFTHSAAFRRDVFNQVGGFDERMPNNGDDLELSYRLATNGHRILFAPKALVYHKHPATWSDYINKKFGRGFWRTLVFKRYPDKLVRDSYTPQLLKLQIFLVGLASLLLLLSFVGPGWIAGLALLVMAAMLLSTVPFALRMHGPLKMKLLAPFFLTIQAAAVGAGVLLGLVDRIERYEIGGRRKT